MISVHQVRIPFRALRRGALASLLSLAAGAGLVAALPAPAHAAGTPTTAAARIRHVFVIILENKDFADTFGSSRQDPYLRGTLVPAGALLRHYYGIGHVSLDNYIALISGQAPTPDTASDCLPRLSGAAGNFNDVAQTGTTPEGQVIAAHGCVYPASVHTLADQLTAAGLSWKAYMEDMGNDPARESATCGHPALGIGTDRTVAEEGPSAAVPQGDGYATRHDPFVYFHRIIDSPQCRRRVVNLQVLDADLATVAGTPNFSFITPNLCHDGHDGAGTGARHTTCASGEPGGLTSADAFLHTWVPKILASPAYRRDGLLIITFDESNFTSTDHTDAATGRHTLLFTFPGQTCCHQQPGPNLKGVRPGAITLVDTPRQLVRFVVQGYGGDRIGALLLSPFIKPGSSSDVPYNHYSLLGSLEDIFGIREHLGYAAERPREGYVLNRIGNDADVFKALGR